MSHDRFIEKLIVPPGAKIDLRKDYDPRYVDSYINEERAREDLEAGIERLTEYQDMLYAQDTWAVLVIFQALDAAGKDSTIKHVMSGLNPQGTQVASFKAPSAEELDHDFLWRAAKVLPERGRIGIFNRSYYEETLVVRVHPELLEAQKLPASARGKDIWQRRFQQINNFERHLSDSGMLILKFFLNVSKGEQKKRFLDRIEEADKHWKFSAHDVEERAFWDDYQEAYEDVFNNTSTDWAPWYVIPADRKWFTRLAVANVIVSRLAELDLHYPKISDEQRLQLQEAKQRLQLED